MIVGFSTRICFHHYSSLCNTMRNILIETTFIDPDAIESVRYDGSSNEVVIKICERECRYKQKKTVETYVLNYENPVYVTELYENVDMCGSGRVINK